MKSESQIRQKLLCYRGMLAGMEAGAMVDNPEVFLQVGGHFPREAMEMLNAATKVDELVRGLPVEDQSWMRQWLRSPALLVRQVLETRISVLSWILEQETGGEG